MSARRMLLVPVDGEPRLVEAPDLDAMRKAIDCEWIEIVGVTTPVPYLPPRPGDERGGWALVVDEEGLLNGKPLNRRASLLYGTPEHGHPIVGDALLAREVDTSDGRAMADTLEADALAFLTARGAA